MRLVVLESPYKGDGWEDVERNLRYCRAAMADCFQKGDAPLASHALYTQEGVLNDKIPEERAKGMEAGLLWGKHAAASIFYLDLGMTPGMDAGLKRALEEKRLVEYRFLGPDWDEATA